MKDAPIGMSYNQTAKEVGFKEGDILFAADGVELDRYDEKMLSQVVDARVVTVLRDGKEAVVYIPEDMMQRLMTDSIKFASFRMPFVIDSVAANSPASQAGLTVGDRIVALDDIPVSYFEYMDAIGQRRDKKLGLDNDSIDLHQIALTYVRNGETYNTVVRTDSNYIMGVTPRAAGEVMPFVTKEYGFIASFPAGARLGVQKLSGYVNNMKYVFSKEGAKQIGGFGTLGSIFPAKWDWHTFWYMTAFLSIILAFMNILPIPALDGGHVLFLLYEIIARRKPSDKFMEYAQMAGMLLLFGLLIWANFNDVLRFIF